MRTIVSQENITRERADWRLEILFPTNNPMKGETTQTVKSKTRKIERWLRLALNIKTREPTAPIKTAIRRILSRSLLLDVFFAIISFKCSRYNFPIASYAFIR